MEEAITTLDLFELLNDAPGDGEEPVVFAPGDGYHYEYNGARLEGGVLVIDLRRIDG
jgi:hypothetical protein